MGSHAIDTADWVFDAEPISVIGTGGVDYWKDGREVHDNVHVIFDYPGGARHSFYSLLFNGHPSTRQLILGDQGALDLTDDRGIYYQERIASVSKGPAKENWWAGSTVTKQAVKKGVPIIPDKKVNAGGFMDRELRYAKHWAASMGIYRYEEPYDPYWAHLVNFFSSIQEGKPVIAQCEAGAANSLAVIYANRAIDTGQKVCWPKTSA